MAGTQFRMKELTLLQHIFLALLLVFFFSFSFLTCNARTQSYDPIQLNAMQAIWNDWNQRIPDQSSNLAGWNSSQEVPCQQYMNGLPNWRGVQCLTNILCTKHPNTGEVLKCSAFIVGLILNNASIVGSLPPAIGNSTTLMTLELTGNPKLGGLLPSQLGLTQLNTLMQGNPFSASPDSSDGKRYFSKRELCFNSAPLRNSDKRKVVIIVVVTIVSSLLVLLISVVVLIHRNKRYEQYLQLQLQQKFEEFDVNPTIFHYNQLKTATRDFHPDTKLGQGAYGAVFKGMLSNGNVVAVKQLFVKTNQGIDEFLNEVVLLTGMKHRNLVNLKGCCIRKQQRFLVYEYVDNYDIDHVLLVGANKALLSWPVRMKICLGVARGLLYLHALAHPKIIHRDIKASNILLTQNYEAKIADFGLALLFPDEESYILTKHVAGTKGYLAPEYASYGQLSDKVDVFSFGVLCLEVVSGRRNIDDKVPPHEMYLSKWAWELHREGRLMDMVDPALSLQDEEVQEVQRLINTALLCIRNAADQRPSMERVVAILQGDSEWESMATLQGGTDEEYLDTMRLFAASNRGLIPVNEDGESSFMNSSRSRLRDEALSTGATLELSEIRVK